MAVRYRNIVPIGIAYLPCTRTKTCEDKTRPWVIGSAKHFRYTACAVPGSILLVNLLGLLARISVVRILETGGWEAAKEWFHERCKVDQHRQLPWHVPNDSDSTIHLDYLSPFTSLSTTRLADSLLLQRRHRFDSVHAQSISFTFGNVDAGRLRLTVFRRTIGLDCRGPLSNRAVRSLMNEPLVYGSSTRGPCSIHVMMPTFRPTKQSTRTSTSVLDGIHSACSGYSSWLDSIMEGTGNIRWLSSAYTNARGGSWCQSSDAQAVVSCARS